MEMRVFGRTGMQLSVLGFGCGAVGGQMVRGDPLDQERTIARAIASGVNYFDTAVQYGSIGCATKASHDFGFALSHPAMGTILIGVGNAATVRGCAHRGPKRPVAGRRA